VAADIAVSSHMSELKDQIDSPLDSVRTCLPRYMHELREPITRQIGSAQVHLTVESN